MLALQCFSRCSIGDGHTSWGDRYSLQDWTPDIEADYIDLIRSGKITEFVDNLDFAGGLLDNEMEWDVAEDETFLAQKF